MSPTTYILLGLLVIVGWALFNFRGTFFNRKGENIPDSDAKSEEEAGGKQEKEVSD